MLCCYAAYSWERSFAARRLEHGEGKCSSGRADHSPRLACCRSNSSNAPFLYVQRCRCVMSLAWRWDDFKVSPSGDMEGNVPPVSSWESGVRDFFWSDGWDGHGGALRLWPDFPIYSLVARMTFCEEPGGGAFCLGSEQSIIRRCGSLPACSYSPGGGAFCLGHHYTCDLGSTTVFFI